MMQFFSNTLNLFFLGKVLQLHSQGIPGEAADARVSNSRPLQRQHHHHSHVSMG